MMPNHIAREYTAFLDKVRDRARKSPQLFMQRNRWVEPLAVTRETNYDAETERLRALMKGARRGVA